MAGKSARNGGLMARVVAEKSTSLVISSMAKHFIGLSLCDIDDMCQALCRLFLCLECVLFRQRGLRPTFRVIFSVFLYHVNALITMRRCFFLFFEDI